LKKSGCDSSRQSSIQTDKVSVNQSLFAFSVQLLFLLFSMTQESITIFYTDDDRDDIAIFEDAVSEVGGEINLLTQSNGASLIHQLKNPPPVPTMVFLDWNMPGKNGDEVLIEIRATKSLHHIPVLVFSTSSSIENIEAARRLGANMYVTKPSSFNDIVQIIRDCVEIDWKNFSDPEKFVYSAG
jgi:CheY-like chemotaxis protein